MENPRKYLDDYRATLKEETKKCAHRDTEFTTKFFYRKYCSVYCKNKAYKKKKFNSLNHICLFCGKSLTKLNIGKSRFKFCCDKHKENFHNYKQLNRKVLLRITDKIVIETNNYDNILKIVERYKNL